MTDRIEIEMSVAGAEQAARGVDSVTESLTREGHAAEHAGDATEHAQASFTDMSRGGIQLVQRLQGVSGAIQSVASALGSRDHTAGLIASVAGATAQFATMGSMLGPGGALVGGLVGLGTSLYSLASAHEAAAEDARDHADALDDVADSVEGLGAVMMEWRDVLGLENAVRAGGAALRDVSDSALSAELRTREARLMELRVANAESGALVRSEEEIRLRREVDGLQEEIDRREREAARGHGGGGASEAVTEYESENTQARGPGAVDSLDADERAADADAIIAARDAAVAADQARITSTNDRIAAEMAAEEEKRQAVLDLEREGFEARLDLEREHLAHVAELEEQQKEASIERRRQAMERMVEQQEEFMQLGMNVVGMLTNALGDIASGEKSAEDAFKGLAKAFLQMISQYTALKAATEFADAIASFARYDYSGGAQHLAAGAAFTAVAVATGVGAAAIPSGSSAQAAGARPQPSANDGHYGPATGNVTIMFNSPVMTAATQDDLARDMEAMIRVGRSRAA